MNARMAQCVQLVAHRGDPVHAPENTMASWESAVVGGARALEIDLRRTRDGEWVIFHDPTLRRTARKRGRIAKKRGDFLKQLDVGSWFSPRFKKEKIRSFPEALDFCRRKNLSLFLDLKVSRYEEEIFHLVQGSGWMDHVLIGAGTIPSLRRWRSLDKRIPLFWVTGFRTRVTSRCVSQACHLQVTGLASYKKRITKQTVDRLHAAGLKCYLWTVRTPAELRRFSAIGVDGIMSEVWPVSPSILSKKPNV